MKQEYYKVYDNLGNLHLVTPSLEKAKVMAQQLMRIMINKYIHQDSILININIVIDRVFL